MKTCRVCSQDLPLDAYARDGRGGRRNDCRSCAAEYKRRVRLNNLEARRKQERDRKAAARRADPLAARERDKRTHRRLRDRRVADMRERKFMRWGDDPDTVAYIKQLMRDPCAYCGDFGSTSVDHIEPKAGGGDDHWENLTLACRSCNARKCNKPLLLWLAHRNGCFEYRQDMAA